MDALNKILNDNDTSQYIRDILIRLSVATSRKEMYEILDGAVKNNADFNCVDHTVFVGGNFKFQCTLSLYTDRLDVVEIKSDIPNIETVFAIRIADSDMSVVVTKYRQILKPL